MWECDNRDYGLGYIPCTNLLIFASILWVYKKSVKPYSYWELSNFKTNFYNPSELMPFSSVFLNKNP